MPNVAIACQGGGSHTAFATGVLQHVLENWDETDDLVGLSGNISLNQELRFIERVNDWIDAGHLSDDRFTKTDVRRIQLASDLGHATKVDRSPRFVADLLERGRSRAAEFLAGR